MKKILLVFLVLLSTLFGCSETRSDKKQIVCTIFPQYDFVGEIIGDKKENFEITLLLDNGVDLHSYQPSVDDMMLINNCDLFIFVGGESDEQFRETIERSENDEVIIINLMDTLKSNIKLEEAKEGMEQEDEEEEAYDEHVWLSIKNCEIIVEEICEQICQLDPVNSDYYQNNCQNYLDKLVDLNSRYAQVCENGNVDTLLFGDRFPFRYLCDDYNLNYYAAFAGCSAASEASFETIVFLANKLDELNLNYVCILDSSDGKIGKTIIENSQNTNREIVTLNSIQSVTLDDIKNGTSYLSLMEDNLVVLQEVLDNGTN